MNMKSKKISLNLTFAIIFICLIVLFVGLIRTLLAEDEGEYDYCIEWSGINNGTLHRDSLLFQCFNLATNTFYCDYEIQNDGSLMIKVITNITKDDEGMITKIMYDEPNYFNCKRWLKSR